MRNILNQSLKLFLLCAALATLFTLGGGHAQAQVTFSGTTIGSVLTDNAGTPVDSLGGLTFTGSDFGGTTSNVLNLSQQNNNLGTLTYFPEFGEVYGGFYLRVSFTSPTGFSIPLPVELGGTVFGFGEDYYYADPNNFAIIDFPNDAFSVFFDDGAGGQGLFSFRLDDVCLSGGQPCSFPEYREGRLGRSLGKSPSTLARRSERSGGGNVSWLKAKGSRNMFAPGLLSNRSLSALESVDITLTGQIVVSSQSGCVQGQGYYLNTVGAIPNYTVGQFGLYSELFVLTLGTNSAADYRQRYDQEELLAILNQPVGKNGGLIALAQQLIAAKLNALTDDEPASIALDIMEADNLIGTRVVPPTDDSTDFLTTKQTSRLVNNLTRYNEGRLAGTPKCR